MKLFAVTAEIEYPNPPAWLGPYRAKYDEPWKPHSTLKQPTWINDDQVATVKDRVASVMKQFGNGEIPIVFDEVQLSPRDPANPLKGNTIMIGACEFTRLADLQRAIVDALSEYRQYRKPHSEEYERIFKPHQTVARHLDDATYQQAIHELPPDPTIRGVVREVVLSIVNDHSVEAALDPKNRTVFSLVAQDGQ